MLWSYEEICLREESAQWNLLDKIALDGICSMEDSARRDLLDGFCRMEFAGWSLPDEICSINLFDACNLLRCNGHDAVVPVQWPQYYGTRQRRNLLDGGLR